MGIIKVAFIVHFSARRLRELLHMPSRAASIEPGFYDNGLEGPRHQLRNRYRSPVVAHAQHKKVYLYALQTWTLD